MQSINLIKYINTSLFPSLNSNIIKNNSSCSFSEICNISHNKRLPIFCFKINENSFEQNLSIEENLSDIKLVKNIILSSRNPGVFVALPGFIIQLINLINQQLFKNINYISNLILKIKDNLDMNKVSLRKVQSLIYNFISITILIILFNFIFSIIYFTQILYIIVFFVLNFIISIFYIL